MVLYVSIESYLIVSQDLDSTGLCGFNLSHPLSSSRYLIGHVANRCFDTGTRVLKDPITSNNTGVSKIFGEADDGVHIMYITSSLADAFYCF